MWIIFINNPSHNLHNKVKDLKDFVNSFHNIPILQVLKYRTYFMFINYTQYG
uniref:Uncharacterized protein n=1 Tax=Physcomitrium patens TaxID=3218 RepID=A0A2K1KC07_PHYPA|nr:hypothetical protein PHYPA_010489 [Physcomitrium patens]